MRYLAVDFGERRIGLAISDAEGRLASPFGVIERRSDDQALQEIARISRHEEVEALVVGEPRRLDGSRGEAAERAARFAEKLAGLTGLPCSRLDEALTSVDAASRLREAGVPRRRRRLDAVAAQILLQEFLDRESAGR